MFSGGVRVPQQWCVSTAGGDPERAPARPAVRRGRRLHLRPRAWPRSPDIQYI